MQVKRNYKLLDASDNSKYGFYCGRGQLHYLEIAFFDPWTGKYLLSSYKSIWDIMGYRYPKLCKRGIKAVTKIIRIKLAQERNMHKGQTADEFDFFVCDRLYDIACSYGPDRGMTRLTYIPTIRTFAFFKKNEKGVFDALDYCPFCGAKLPTRLDEKLSEILQNEYGLKDWHDYKKAPHEFHTNEWWIKRGL